ncbi:hypothetical protein N8146_06295 [Ascidiaceihabitans sp.]|nr:hypothetical protein [Ascidiaceihabitans sp.]
MKRGTDNASLFDESVGPEQQGYSSNMKLMMIVAAFLIVTIGLILVQPNVAPNQLVENEPTELTKTADLASVPSADYSNSEAVVTRSETSLLSVGGIQRVENVSKLLRQPIRLNGATRDIRALSREVWPNLAITLLLVIACMAFWYRRWLKASPMRISMHC